MGLRHLEDSSDKPSKKIALARTMRQHADGIPLFGLLYGQLLAETGKKADARQVMRSALEQCGEADVRTRLLVHLAMTEPQTAESQDLLRQAVALNGHLAAAASARLALAAS